MECGRELHRVANKRTAQPVVVSSLRLPAALAEWLNQETERRGYDSRHKFMIAILEGREEGMKSAKD
jgi:hypothetical protein